MEGRGGPAKARALDFGNRGAKKAEEPNGDRDGSRVRR
jgi:hypothetical protein